MDEDEYYSVPENQRLDVDDTVPNPDADDYTAGV